MKVAFTTVMDNQYSTVRDGLRWPVQDEKSWAVRGEVIPSLDEVMQYVQTRECVIQAGGNCGIWPAVLAKVFRKVYTFEPDPVNFHCLVNNCQFPNVVKLQAALGKPGAGPIELDGHPINCGSYFVRTTDDGLSPVLSIDQLNIPKVGLIYLDIEGFEYFALEGARETIARDRPVLAVEQKKLGIERFGLGKDDLETLLAGMGYRKVSQVLKDHVYIPQEQA